MRITLCFSSWLTSATTRTSGKTRQGLSTKQKQRKSVVVGANLKLHSASPSPSTFFFFSFRSQEALYSSLSESKPKAQ